MTIFCNEKESKEPILASACVGMDLAST